MKPKVWFSPGIVMIYGVALDVDEHKHNAIQIVWPETESMLEVGDANVTTAALLAAQAGHKLSLKSGLTVLVEPRSVLGEALSGFLQGKDWVAIEDLPPFALEENSPFLSSYFPVELLLPLRDRLKLKLTKRSFIGSSLPPDLDIRIAKLQTHLNTCFIRGEGLNPKNWRAAKIAAGLSLSEGRFLHLFRQEMGVSWRPYLLWRRLLCAVELINNGHSATAAAELSGFSDNAHLSRTFRCTFGLSIRQAAQIFR